MLMHVLSDLASKCNCFETSARLLLLRGVGCCYRNDILLAVDDEVAQQLTDVLCEGVPDCQETLTKVLTLCHAPFFCSSRVELTRPRMKDFGVAGTLSCIPHSDSV